MGNGRSLAVLIGACLLTAVAFAHRCGKASAGNAEHGESVLAKTPPMGWNSWDGYGTTINEEQFKANAKWIAEHLTMTDAWTTSLLTNPEVIEVDQHSTGNRPAVVTGKTVVWLAKSEDKKFHYVAAFNRGSVGSDVKYSWKDLGLEGNEYNLRDLWNRKDMGEASELAVKLPAHGCAMFRLSR